MNWKEHIAATFSWLPKDPDIIWDGWGIAVVSALLGLAVAALRWLYRLRKATPDSSQHFASDYLAKNRQPLLRRLRKDLDSRFSSFLLDRSPLELTKTVAPDEVNHPRSLQDSIACILERDGTALETTNQPVAALFDRPDVGRRLAILGKPGSGKTVCLLTLLEHLLHEAEADEAAPLPLLFECSEWDGRELPSWMAWQLHRRYAFPEDTACQLVQTGDIFPLFDGLDELAAGKQDDFIRAFNAFADNRPLVLCCRIEEYRNLRKHTGQKLSLNTALILQDISPQQIEGHLRRQGLDELWSLIECSEREAISQPLCRQKSKKRRRTPQNLLQIAQRPLFFGLMIKLAGSIREGWSRRQGETWEDCIWKLYLDQCLKEQQANWNKSPDSYGVKYRQEQSMHWLRCLARWMQTENKVALQIDELQPSMLRQYWRFEILSGLIYGLIMTAGNSLLVLHLFFQQDTTVPSIMHGVIFATLMSMLLARSYFREINPIRPLRLPVSWQDVKNMTTGLSLGFIYNLIIGFAAWSIVGLVGGLSFWLIQGLIIGLSGGLIGGLTTGLRVITDPINEATQPQERLQGALHTSLLLLPVLIFSAMIIFFQVMSLSERWKITPRSFFDMQFFYAFLFMIAIFIFLTLDIHVLLQHYLLRLCLRWEG